MQALGSIVIALAALAVLWLPLRQGRPTTRPYPYFPADDT